VRFDFDLTFPRHKIIFLDTRTHRGYPGGGKEAPDLLNLAAGPTGANELQRQVTQRLNPAVPVTIVIAPAPVFGHPIVEWIQAKVGDHRDSDREVWRVDGRPALFEGLLEALVPFKRVVILSGDIHFGFTAQVRYFDDRQAPGRAVAIAQLNS